MMAKKPGFSDVAALQRRPMMTTVRESVLDESKTQSGEQRSGEGVRGDQDDRRPVRRGKRALTFWVQPEPHKQFKMLAVREDRPGQDLLEEALDDLFAKYGMHRIARHG
ncbi:ribbon-helix-helix domain-containing protein [Acidiphilium acidophilum]|uniref:ribbon-helix-helix domain-containing protein n=1 Tax=Acidiphilium acidophilum TaxID=76588 RepID=UPI002E8E6497|nr:ribbon-helix-helix domain-containing protein [Acidiphilium acidophilum]